MTSEVSTAEQILSEILKLDPDATGSIMVERDEKGAIYATGDLQASVRSSAGSTVELVGAAMRNALPNETHSTMPFVPVAKRAQVFSSLDVSAAAKDNYKDREVLYTRDPSDPPRRERHVNVLYSGRLRVDLITPNNEYKKENWQTRDKVGNCMVELGFIAPLVLDLNMKIIDGQQRLSLAKELDIKEVFVVILDVEGVKADFLRLAMNRSTEFQKWKHGELDSYINGNPNLQPLLEPLGFFGERILPVSFFGDTIISYKLDEFHYQQGAYKQEEGLAKWAEIQRERIASMEKPKKKARNVPEEPEGLNVGLFG